MIAATLFVFVVSVNNDWCNSFCRCYRYKSYCCNSFLLILLKDDCCSSFFFNDTVKNDCLDIFKVTTVTKWLLQVRVRVPNRSLTRYIISKERCMLLILEVLYTELAQIMMRCCAFCMENITYHVREWSPPEALNWCNSLGILQARGGGGGVVIGDNYCSFLTIISIFVPEAT